MQKKITAIVGGETDSEVFYKNLLDHMVVYKENKVEVCLNRLPQKWIFALEPLCRNGPSVPISVSRPFSSG